MPSEIQKMVLETVRDFYETGTVSEITLREVEALCLPEPKPYAPRTIARIRRKLKLSQAAFARFLNTSTSTIQKWERGDKKPSGPALKLLHLVAEKGLPGII